MTGPPTFAFPTDLGEKIGKGTTAYYLAGKLERGEDTVFGPTKHAVTTLILTEEPMESVREKVDAFGLDRSDIIYGYELAAKPWPEKIDALVEQARLFGHAVVFVDNVSRSAGVEEEGGVELARAAELLQDACRAVGLALIIDHHHKKGRDSVENKSRGGTGLAGAMDINVELERIGGIGSRKRRFTARGRLRATNWKLAVELAVDGTDYVVVEDAAGGADDEDDQQMLDLIYLSTAGSVTTEAFAAMIDRKPRTAQRRLGELVKAGKAAYTPGEAGPDGKFAPGTWSSVPISQEPTP